MTPHRPAGQLCIHTADYIAWHKHATGKWIFNCKKGEIISRQTGKPLVFAKTSTGYLSHTTYVNGVPVSILKHRAIWVVACGILILPLLYPARS